MTTRLAVVMDPIGAISYKKDTTLALLVAARKRGWRLYYTEQPELYMDGGTARARLYPLEVAYDPQDWYALGEPEDRALSTMDVILMRKDPPFDNDYIYSTYMLEEAEQQGTLVVNRPQSLRDCNEKMYATQFPQCCPPFLVSCLSDRLKAFHHRHGDVIFKPLDGMGGGSIFRVRQDDPNISVIIETLTLNGRRQIMAQRFIPEIVDGDKRILMVDGEPVPWALARVPAVGESRGNLAAGGTGVARQLTDRDRWICGKVRESIRRRGLLFVGLDIIGDYLTEINVTSPTCIRELDRAQDLDIGGDVIDCIDRKLGDLSRPEA